MQPIQFSKRVGKTIQNGQITVPKEFDSILDKHLKCPEGVSIDVDYRIGDKGVFKGRIYQSINNTTSYYQFYLIDSSDKKIFKDFCERAVNIHIKFEIEEKFLLISK